MIAKAVVDRVARGRSGEEAAASYLSAKGYRVVARNQRTKAGELDLICARDGQYIMVEVKARASHECGSAFEAIGRRKARRLRAAAVWWLAERGLFPCRVRFDAIAVQLDGDGAPCSLEHLEDVLGDGSGG